MGPRRRHELLYIDTTVYRVDDTVFRLPSRYLENAADSSPISAKFEGAGGSKGSSDKNPVWLSPLPYNGNARDFENLASVVIALTADLSMPTNYTLKQWLSVIKLSTSWGLTHIRAIGARHLENWTSETPLDQWLDLLEFFTSREEFSDMRSICLSRISVNHPYYTLDQWISALDVTFGQVELLDVSGIAISRISSLKSQLSSIDKVKLGRKFRTREWVHEGLEGLIQQESPPSFSELETIGLQTALRMLHIRDLTRPRAECGQCGITGVPLCCEDCEHGPSAELFEPQPPAGITDLNSLITRHFPEDLILQDSSTSVS